MRRGDSSLLWSSTISLLFLPDGSLPWNWCTRSTPSSFSVTPYMIALLQGGEEEKKREKQVLLHPLTNGLDFLAPSSFPDVLQREWLVRVPDGEALPVHRAEGDAPFVPGGDATERDGTVDATGIVRLALKLLRKFPEFHRLKKTPTL